MQSRARAQEGESRNFMAIALATCPTTERTGSPPNGSDWRRPTLEELAADVEHQFGEIPALAGVHSLGFASDEPLTPGDVREVCDLLGVPATELGVDG